MIVRCATLLLLLLCGSLATGQELIPLKAGRLSMVFDPETAMLRYIHYGEHQILQGISAPVRDQFWGTVPPVVSNLKNASSNNVFAVEFDVTCRQGDIDFQWHGRIAGTAQGELIYSFEGQAHSSFLRNRIGFCVLHGPEAAGKACVVETVDGESMRGHFPKFISPHQPFKNIRTITHDVAPGLKAAVRMEGDTFEMEDQRNWTDASFKTYCTPLEIPYPVRIEQGTKISQRIAIHLEGADSVPHQENSAQTDHVVLRLSQGQEPLPLPGIGVRVSSQVRDLSETEVARLRALQLDHLRVDVTPSQESAVDELKRAVAQARQLNLALQIGLHLGEKPADELARLAPVVKDLPQPATWLLITANEEQVSAARAFLQQHGLKGRLGRGEDTNFTELNRSRPDPQTVDAVSYGINPQIHAIDYLSIIETLPIQGDTVRSAREFAGNLPILATPITLKSQTIHQAAPPGELPPNVDPRQVSPFAAAWTLGSLKYLAEAGAASVTYYETVGWLGLMESADGTPLPDRFPSRPGETFPIYDVLREVAAFSGGRVRATESSDPMSVVSLVLEKDERRVLLLANLTPVAQSALLQGLRREVSGQTICAASGKDAKINVMLTDDGVVIQLPPHSVVAVGRQ